MRSTRLYPRQVVKDRLEYLLFTEFLRTHCEILLINQRVSRRKPITVTELENLNLSIMIPIIDNWRRISHDLKSMSRWRSHMFELRDSGEWMGNECTVEISNRGQRFIDRPACRETVSEIIEMSRYLRETDIRPKPFSQIKEEMIRKTWHPERFWDWCLDEEDKV